MESEKYCFMTIVMSIIYSHAAAASKIQVKKEKKNQCFFSLMKRVTVEFLSLINYEMLFVAFSSSCGSSCIFSEYCHVNFLTKKNQSA